MGCDIHLWVEVRRDGRWEFADPFEEVEYEDERWIEWTQPYRGRDYFLFCILAGVRKRHVAMKPIASPRGMPADVSEIGARIMRELDGHSASWLGAEEVLSYDWNTAATLHGYVKSYEAALYRATGRPPSEPSYGPSENHSVYLEWVTREHKRELCHEFVEVFLPKLEQYGPPEDVRICFFFDN